MIRQQPNQTEFIDFMHPFGGKLPASNRWIKLSHLVPWDEVQTLYSKGFKKTKPVEFGAKLSISHLASGYVTVDKLSWDAYNESGDLTGQIESYRKRFGYYSASVHADTIYQTRSNRKYCNELGIRLTGKQLGSPPKETEENKAVLKAKKKEMQQDKRDRIRVEGKFGNAKREGSLGRIMAKLSYTAESVIHVGIIVLNLDKYLREVLCCLIHRCLMYVKFIEIGKPKNGIFAKIAA